MNKGGFGAWVDKADKGVCPVCNKTVKSGEFKDDLSFKEFTMSGMCQSCQDEFFNSDDDEQSDEPIE
jgi:uncharacterized CHY-type Zn-finger protein